MAVAYSQSLTYLTLSQKSRRPPSPSWACQERGGLAWRSEAQAGCSRFSLQGLHCVKGMQPFLEIAPKCRATSRDLLKIKNTIEIHSLEYPPRAAGALQQLHSDLDRHDLSLLDVRVDHLAHPARDGSCLEEWPDPESCLFSKETLLPYVVWELLRVL